MSVFKTTAHEKSQNRDSWPQRIQMIAIVAGLGLVLGYGISNIDTSHEPTAKADPFGGVLSSEQFYRLNTEGLLPSVERATQLEPVDTFWHLNVDSFGGLLQIGPVRYPVDPAFLEINTTGLVFTSSAYNEPSRGPR